MTETTCSMCEGPGGESKAWHESVIEPGDLDLVEYQGARWHRKCAENDRATREDSTQIKREAARQAWNR